MDLRIRTKPGSAAHPKPIIVLNSPKPLKTGLRILQHAKTGGELWISVEAKPVTLSQLWPDLQHNWEVKYFRDVRDITASLYGRGYKKLLLEGGPTLNGLFFTFELVDEFFLTLLPILWGGRTFDRTVMSESPLRLEHFRLQSAEKRKNEMFFRYTRKKP